MIKVQIKKQGIVTNSATFNSQEEAEAWVSQEIQNNSFGKSERWVLDGMEDVSNAIDVRDRLVRDAIPESFDEETGEIIPEIPAQYIAEYKLPAEYLVEYLDITSDLNEQTKLSEGKARQELGSLIIAKVYSINEGKNINAQQFSALMSDPTLERIERLLWTGSLRTAKLMIQNLDNTYFTDNEKASILSILSDF